MLTAELGNVSFKRKKPKERKKAQNPEAQPREQEAVHGAKRQRNVRALNPCLHQRLMMMALLLLDVSQKSQVQPYILRDVFFSQEMISELNSCASL